MQDEKLTFHLNDEEVTFDIYKLLKQVDDEKLEYHELSTIVTSSPSSNSFLNDDPTLSGKTNGMLDVKLENHKKHVSSFDNAPSSSYMLLKPKMKYEKVMQKHVRDDVVGLIKLQHDDYLMILNYFSKDDVELDNDLLTGKLNVHDYVCECQCGRKLKIQGGSKHGMEKLPWDPT